MANRSILAPARWLLLPQNPSDIVSTMSGAVALFLLLLLPAASYAQVLYGSLTGNVTDLSTSAVPGAKVEAVNTNTGVVRQTTTDERGVYAFNDLQPGAYKVTITSGAFSTF